MVYTTLKANKEAGIEFIDIVIYTEEVWTVVADLFNNSEKYYDETNETDFEKLSNDYTYRQMASACLKYLKQLAKDKEEPLMIWEKIFFDLDCGGEIAFDECEDLIKQGLITGANQLKEIEKKARRKGRTIRKEYRYGENDIYCGYKYLSDLVDEYFPCYAEVNDDYCNNCGNCQ